MKLHLSLERNRARGDFAYCAHDEARPEIAPHAEAQVGFPESCLFGRTLLPFPVLNKQVLSADFHVNALHVEAALHWLQQSCGEVALPGVPMSIPQ